VQSAYSGDVGVLAGPFVGIEGWSGGKRPWGHVRIPPAKYYCIHLCLHIVHLISFTINRQIVSESSIVYATLENTLFDHRYRLRTHTYTHQTTQ